MKKFLFLGALAAMLLGTTSCSNDMEPAMSSDGTVSFKVELPGNFESRTISDGTTATKLEVACYNANGEILADLQPTVKTDFENRVATVTYKLVKGQEYNFAFFAHADGAPYTFTPGTNMAGCKFDVKNYTGVCNDETRDAFYAVLKNYSVTTAETEVKLHRPFAQLNFGADDLAAAKAAGITPSQSMVTISKAATTFGLFTEEATGEAAVEYTLADLPDATTVDGVMTPAILKVEDKNYDWMEMCYFLVPGNEANVNVEMTLKTNGSDVKVPVANVPVKKNHRTNIVGSLFTQDANFRIIIDQNFDNFDYDIVNGQLMLKAGMKTDEINKLIASGFGSFALAENLDIDAPIVVPAGVTATLNLNGHNIINTKEIWAGANWSLISVRGGNLTINGNGDVIAKADDCYAIDVRDDGNITINGGNYSGNITAVYAHDGHATINGGSFTIQQLSDYNDYRYMLNLLDANGRNGTASIEVNGGKYYQFNPENNLAEGSNTNFLGEGYEAVQDGDWYKVQQIPALSDPNAIAAAAAIPGKYVNVAPGIEVTINLNNVAEGVTINGNGAKLILNQSNNKVNSKNVTIKNFTIDNNQSGNASIDVRTSIFNMKDCVIEPSASHSWGVYMNNTTENGVYNYDGLVFDAPREGRLMGLECKGVVNISNSYLKGKTYTLSTLNSVYDCDINVSNTQLIGWTSFNTGSNHVYNFENCYFGKLNYGYFRPYGGNGTNVTNMNNCTFSNDYDGVDPIEGMTINANGCKWENGTAIDASLFNIRSGSTIYIDGVLVE